MVTRKVFEPIPLELQEDYSKLEIVLKSLAKEKGFLYNVKEWRPWFYSKLEETDNVESIKRYTFAGYKIDHGVIRPRTILFASFDSPETYDLKSPLPAEDQTSVLGVSYDPFYFLPSQFQGKLKEAFPRKYTHIEEMNKR